MGYDGGKTLVKDFVQKVRPEQGVPAVLRYETKPGLAQVDWGELGTVELDGKKCMKFFEQQAQKMKILGSTFMLNKETLLLQHGSWIFQNEIC